MLKRRANLLELVRQNGFASLPSLAESLQVSESTVRRDLAHLEQEGLAKRTHGGAFYSGPSPDLPHFRNRQNAEWGKKRAIARVAAEILRGTNTLLLDGGSTTYELACLLIDRPMQVVTNSLPLANLFSSRREVETILVGGYLQPTTGVLLGPYAEEMLGSLKVRVGVISAAGVAESGLYNSNHMTASTQQAMVRVADEVILVADSTKFGRQSIAHLCGLDEIDRIVVDTELSQEWRDVITSAGVSLHLAEPTSEETADPEKTPR